MALSFLLEVKAMMFLETLIKLTISFFALVCLRAYMWTWRFQFSGILQNSLFPPAAGTGGTWTEPNSAGRQLNFGIQISIRDFVKTWMVAWGGCADACGLGGPRLETGKWSLLRAQECSALPAKWWMANWGCCQPLSEALLVKPHLTAVGRPLCLHSVWLKSLHNLRQLFL